MEPIDQARQFLANRIQTCQLHRLGENHLDELVQGILVHWIAPLANAQRALDAEREKVKELEAMYRQQLDERDKRIGELAESAKIWMERRNTLQAQLAALEAQLRQVEEWRDTVTLALQRPGGARFEDVPEHIKVLVKDHATLRQLVEALLKEWDDDSLRGYIECMKKLRVATCEHQWGTDGMHSNEFCKRCFISKPHPTEERHE